MASDGFSTPLDYERKADSFGRSAADPMSVDPVPTSGQHCPLSNTLDRYGRG